MQQTIRTFRLNCGPEQRSLVEELLTAQGFCFEPDPFYPAARRLLAGPLALGSSLAAFFGYIYIQDRSSMLPPLALAPGAGAAVLDMCASPGSKTGMLAQLTGDTGFVLGNEPGAKRLGTLRRNLQAQNFFCCATSNYAGEELPLPAAGAPWPGGEPGTGRAYPGWESILLDPPCSGWGTAEKNPQVLRLWQGDKVAPLIDLQRRLLTRAASLLRPGGRLAYSTCTTNRAENEEQVRFAVEGLGLELVPLDAPPDFALARPALAGCEGVWRVEDAPHSQDFFVALLRKKAAADCPAAGQGAEAGQESGPDDFGPNGFGPDCPGPNPPGLDPAGFFVRPWEKESRFVGERRRHGRKKGGGTGPAFELLARQSLQSPCFDPCLLPEGDIAVFNTNVYFLPQASKGLVPPGFTWKAFALGRLSGQGGFRAAPGLRRLMPGVGELGARALVLEDIEPLLSLVSGRPLTVDAPGGEMGLFYKALPLCRVSVKGRRALLPPL